MLPESLSQFVAFGLEVYDIHFQIFFKLFSFCCSFRQIVTFFHQWEVTSNFLYFKKTSTDIIGHRCFVCWAICVFINVFWVVICVSFSLLSEQSRSNRSQWFTSVVQIHLFNLSVCFLQLNKYKIGIELKIPNIQIIANDFNGSNSLCFRKPFVILKVFLLFVSEA